MKKAVWVSALGLSLLIAAPAQPVLAQQKASVPARPVINSTVFQVLSSAAKLHVLPSYQQELRSAKVAQQRVANPSVYDKRPSPSRGDTGSFDARRLIRIALSLKGSPYKWSGQTPNGFDCSGFTRYVFKAAAGIELPHSSAEQAGVGIAVSRADLEPGDLVFFRTSGGGISHVGIYIGGDNFVSATDSLGVAVASLSDTYWGSRYAGARRINR